MSYSNVVCCRLHCFCACFDSLLKFALKLQVCSESTGHAEAVQLQFNPEEVQYGTLVDLFYSRHDSTTPNRAGNDVGTQYRSGIYYQDDEQKKVFLDMGLMFPLCREHSIQISSLLVTHISSLLQAVQSSVQIGVCHQALRPCHRPVASDVICMA